MQDDITADTRLKVGRVRKVLNREPGDRLSMGDYALVEYRPDIYHLGDNEAIPAKGHIGVTRDGKRLVTQDGGVWATDAKEKYPTPEHVLDADLSSLEAEAVDRSMLSTMADLYAGSRDRGFVMPLHYATLVTRCTIEFGWEPFLTAAALDPEGFAGVLDSFGRASLAVAQGWAHTEGIELIAIHDDFAGTRGLILNPEFLREYCLPWYRRIFAAIHEQGRRVLYMGDGNYLGFLDDLLSAGPDGLYIESSSMDPEELMSRAGPEKFYLLKTNNQNIDVGSPGTIREELRRLRDLHQRYPGIMMYRGGGNPAAGNAEAFMQAYKDLLVYEPNIRQPPVAAPSAAPPAPAPSSKQG